MVYDRTHTRDLAELQPMNLHKALPFAAVTFIIGGAASMGLPGFSGFVAELQVIQGAWAAFPWFAAIAGLGIILGVAYTLRALLKAFFAENDDDPAPALAHHPLPPISIPERIGAGILLASTIAIGLYPRILMDLIVPAVQSPLFSGMAKGGTL